MNAGTVTPDVGYVVDGKYKIVRALGAGAWAQVFEGVHERIHRRVAIKVLGAELADTPDVTERFEQEARAATRIQSPNVVDIFDVGALPDGRPYLVMEFLDGRDLGVILDGERMLTPERAVDLLRQAARGLGDVHHAGVLHRDIKPNNIFVVRGRSDREIVKIVDLGVSKLGNGPQVSKLTATNTIVGSPVYMSPEQCRGMKDMDGRSDIYSLGIVLFEVVTGHLPFDAASFNELMFKIALEDAPDARTKREDLDEELAGIIAKALQRKPEDRYQTAEEFAQALENWQLARGLFPSSDPNLTSAARQLDASLRSSGALPVQPGVASTGANPVVTAAEAAPTMAPPEERRRRKLMIVPLVALGVVGLVLGLRGAFGGGGQVASNAPPRGTVEAVPTANATGTVAAPAVTVGASAVPVVAAPSAAASASAAAVVAMPGAGARPVPARPMLTGTAVRPAGAASSVAPVASATPAPAGTPRAVVEGRTIRTDL